MLKCGIIGFGGLGKLHFGNLKEVTKSVPGIQLVAICDVEEKAFQTLVATNLGENNVDLDLSQYNLYQDAAEMLEKEDLDFVITGLPTYIHEKIAVMAMEKGLHVFSEKPMALTYEQGENMLRVAKEHNVKLMIGQCLRFAPEYIYLKDLIDSGKYGKVIKADFSRISPTPRWSWDMWMNDASRSGGAALDMHVHDVDFINYAFGLPKAVTSFATNYKTGHEAINTVYTYGDKLVTAVGDWAMPDCHPFVPGYVVRFEKATVVMNNSGVTLYPEEGNATSVELPAANPYVQEMIEFVTCILEDRQSPINPPESSLQSIRIALAEKEAADLGKTITF